MFQLDRFIEDCKQAYAEDNSHKAVREVIAKAVSEPNDVINALDERGTRRRLQALPQRHPDNPERALGPADDLDAAQS